MILLCYGTRPEWIKIKPLISAFEGTIDFKVLFTGQHEQMRGFYHDHFLKVEKGANRLDSIFSSIVNLDSCIFNGVEYVLVQGDTASACAMALAAFNRNVKIIHLEAGLRTRNLQHPYPEEGYRQMISRLASIHFCATQNNKTNLLLEKCEGEIFVVGNTVLDNLVGVETEYGDEVLVTMHRRENHPIMREWFNSINNIAKNNRDLKFTIPLHPNPSVMKHKNLLSSLNVVAPLEYNEMINRMSKCRFFISDSGGIQEEGSFLNKKVIVCRKWTERPESIGTHSVLCKSPHDLARAFESVKNNYEINIKCPYGSGNASEMIVKVILGVI
tara:strand:- start:27414 stop:28400 length:987 start_codon:yes stop_codon:yes gene_type:complete